jgi:hypothetical protein
MSVKAWLHKVATEDWRRRQSERTSDWLFDEDLDTDHLFIDWLWVFVPQLAGQELENSPDLVLFSGVASESIPHMIFCSPETASAIVRRLGDVSPAVVRPRFDLAALLASGMPGIEDLAEFAPEELDDVVGYAIQRLGEVRDFYAAAAAEGRGVVVSIS